MEWVLNQIRQLVDYLQRLCATIALLCFSGRRHCRSKVLCMGSYPCLYLGSTFRHKRLYNIEWRLYVGTSTISPCSMDGVSVVLDKGACSQFIESNLYLSNSLGMAGQDFHKFQLAHFIQFSKLQSHQWKSSLITRDIQSPFEICISHC